MSEGSKFFKFEMTNVIKCPTTLAPISRKHYSCLVEFNIGFLVEALFCLLCSSLHFDSTSQDAVPYPTHISYAISDVRMLPPACRRVLVAYVCGGVSFVWREVRMGV